MQEGRKILQYPSYGQSLGGATTDNNVGWSNPDANGYSAVTGVTCPTGQQTCHGRCACVVHELKRQANPSEREFRRWCADTSVEQTVNPHVHMRVLPGRSAWICRTTYSTAALAASPATPLLRCALAACACASPAWHHAPHMVGAAWMLSPAPLANLQCRRYRSQMLTPRMLLAPTRQTKLPVCWLGRQS